MRQWMNLLEDVYHGSVQDHDGTLTQRVIPDEDHLGYGGINQIGTWFTSNPEMAKVYAKSPAPEGGLKDGAVYSYELPEGRFWEADGRHQWDFVRSFLHLADGENVNVDDLSTRFTDLKNLKNTPGHNTALVAKMQKAEAAALRLVRSLPFMKRVRQALLDHGYIGIHWANTDLDQNYLPEIGRHDVWLVFIDTPMVPNGRIA